MQTRKKAKLAESSGAFQNLLEHLHEPNGGRTSDCGQPENTTLVDASRKNVGKLLKRVGDRQSLARKKQENTSIHNGSHSLGRKKQNSAIHGENAMFYQRQSSETNFYTLPSCGMVARMNLDSEPSTKSNDEIHTNNDSAERHENQETLCKSEDDMDREGFDWEDGNIMPSVGSMQGHSKPWSGEITIELEDDDISKQGKKQTVRRATARDKEFAELVHKVHLLCLIGRGMLIDAACNDSLIQASLYSLLPSELLNLGKEQKLTAIRLMDFVKWFQNAFHVQSPDEGTSQPEERTTLIAKLCHAIEIRAGTREEVAALFVALLRALGLTTRYVSVLDVAPLKPDGESLEASADWNSESDSEDGQNLLHMNTTKTTIASLGQVLSRCRYQGYTQNMAVSDADPKSHVRRGRGSKRGSENRDSIPGKITSETTFSQGQFADGEQKEKGTQNENPLAINSEGQGKVIKRKGDLEFEMELAMALAATATETPKKSKREDDMVSNDIPGRAQTDMFTSTSEKGHENRKPRFSSQKKSTAVWSRKLVPCFHWAEVYCEGETLSGRWVHVDAASGVIDGEKKVEEAAASWKRPLRYVLAFAGNGAKDVTRRYVTQWSAIVTQRVYSPWWEVTMAPLKELEAAATAEAVDVKGSTEDAQQPSICAQMSIPGTNHHENKTNRSQGLTVINVDLPQSCDMPTQSLETPGQRVHITDRSSLEDMELEMRSFTEPLPTNQQAYKNHHLYVLERWLTKYQTLYPKGPVLGYCAGKPVYPRTCVQILHTADRWLREGLQVKKGEAAAKILETSRNRARSIDAEAKYFEDDSSEGRTIVLFGRWQTEPLQLPPAINGIVPKNERGQVDVWSEKCLPPGTVYLKMPRLVPIVKKLGIDFAPAMVGFEIRNGRSVPVFDGIVVCEEFRDAILQNKRE
ncbi:DNA repair protein RAD4 isoform X2 [Cryptomeria japonica]|uniref:DNA repair protein RAD4 isoform X2 n=1 Tax=Cryptomeria japonica TaxID=3369 RepID=UPI0027DA7520|nr:DNA repair protein RAD4 isoform X2 [Cryptomeria japonica]